MDAVSSGQVPPSRRTEDVLINSGTSGDYRSNFVTPRVTESPASFHTAEPLDTDYQKIDNPEILDSPQSSSPATSQQLFYSDGRPCPPSDDDDESRDSVDEGGCMSATLLDTPYQFEDPHQPKLLLADDPVEPTENKMPLHDEFVPSPEHLSGMESPEDLHHEALHNDRRNVRRRRRKREASHHGEDTPLLEQSQEERRDGCCCTLL